MNISKPVFSFLHHHAFGLGVFVLLVGFFFFAGGLIAANGQTVGPSDNHVVSLYVDSQETSVPTRAATVGDFIDKSGIKLYDGDLVEPALATPIDGDNFRVQIYRAHPVLIVDGDITKRVLTPHTSPQLIATKAGFTIYPEDILTLSSPDNFLQDGILGQKLTITRATPVLISLYGAPLAVYRTQAKTIGELLVEKGITPAEGSTVTPATTTPITPNMAIFISDPGKTVIAAEEPVPFETEVTNDPTQTFGLVTVTKPGVLGVKQVIYEVSQDGSRVKLNEVVTVQPQTQLQTKGTKSTGVLTKSKGVNQFTDSRGVVHRETYYDLPMSVVMRNCGGNGTYTVREDGAKVDKDGYILVAASLFNYPRCTVVETSMGPGKVYDTGGFTSVHPYGFDLATDWTNYDGR